VRTPALTPDSAASPLLWFAVLGAPLGWAVQFAVGYWLAASGCSPGGGELFGTSLEVWMAPLTALALAAALGAALTALRLYRGSSGASDYDAPPPGRIRFLSVVGLAIAPLFLAMIALTAIGVFSHYPPCAQAQPPSGVVHPSSAGKSRSQLGAELFSANCAVCHGERGEGVPEPDPSSAGGIVGQGPPLIGVGAEAPDFYLRSGRMPLSDPGEQPERRRPFFSEREIDALVAYVASFGGGPAIPDPRPASDRLPEGKSLYTEHCAGCHQEVAQGGYVTGARVPPLQGLDARTIAEAVRIGPYLMPEFPESQIDDRELDAIVAYVQSTDHPEDAGGLGIGHVGPIPEGMAAWLVAGLALVGVCMLLGRRLRT
jgi:ubiquinol-cytochrome c reductase cytochrome c subunit